MVLINISLLQKSIPILQWKMYDPFTYDYLKVEKVDPLKRCIK